MKLGLISDTHDYLDPRVVEIFAGVDHILHAGDIGQASLLVELELIAPVTAVLGNNDYDLKLRDMAVVELNGKTFLVHHIVTPGGPRIMQMVALHAPDVVVFGHSHVAYAQQHEATFFINPGYAGRPRFKQPRSVALMEIKDGKMEHKFVPLP